MSEKKDKKITNYFQISNVYLGEVGNVPKAIDFNYDTSEEKKLEKEKLKYFYWASNNRFLIKIK